MLGPASISGASLRRAPPPVTAHVWPPTSCPLFRSANSRATEGNVSSPYGRTGCRSYATDPPRSDTPAPSNAPQMGSNVTCIKSPEGDQSTSHPQLRPVSLLQSFATTLKGGILVPDRFSPTHAAIQLVRFVSTALTYLATIPVYAATLPIRQMMPRPLARHQHIFLRQHDDFFSQPRQRPDSILHNNQVDAPARQGVCNTGDPHDCYAIGSHAVDYDVDHSTERVLLDLLSLPRLRLARRHTPLRYRFAHAVDHNVDDSADGLRPDSHRRSGEINEASYGCSTRAVRRLVEGGDVGPKPRQTPFTLSLLESRGVVLESGVSVLPVS